MKKTFSDCIVVVAVLCGRAQQPTLPSLSETPAVTATDIKQFEESL